MSFSVIAVDVVALGDGCNVHLVQPSRSTNACVCSAKVRKISTLIRIIHGSVFHSMTFTFCVKMFMAYQQFKSKFFFSRWIIHTHKNMFVKFWKSPLMPFNTFDINFCPDAQVKLEQTGSHQQWRSSIRDILTDSWQHLLQPDAACALWVDHKLCVNTFHVELHHC